MEDWDSLFEKARRSFAGSNIGSDVKFAFDNGRNVHVTAKGSDFSIVADSNAPASTELRMSYADACRLINRELSPSRALATFRLTLKGDMAVAFKVAGVLSRPLPPV